MQKQYKDACALLGRARGAVAGLRGVGLLGGHGGGARSRQQLTAAQLAALLLFAHEAATASAHRV